MSSLTMLYTMNQLVVNVNNQKNKVSHLEETVEKRNTENTNLKTMFAYI